MRWITLLGVAGRRLVGAPPRWRPAARLSSGCGPRRRARPDRGVLLSEPSDPRDGAAEVAAGAPRRPRTRLLLLLALGVFLLDLGSKLLVVATIDRGENIRLLGGAVYLTHTRNTGAAFSFAEGFTVVFSLVAAAVVVVIVRTARRLFSTGWAVTLGLVLGGALGNLVDRVFREPGFLRGGVVDFVSVFAPDGEVYPIFNVADSAIVCGGVLGVLLALRGVEFDGSRSTGGRPARNGGPAPG
jgi:signal peptidase II